MSICLFVTNSFIGTKWCCPQSSDIKQYVSITNKMGTIWRVLPNLKEIRFCLRVRIFCVDRAS